MEVADGNLARNAGRTWNWRGRQKKPGERGVGGWSGMELAGACEKRRKKCRPGWSGMEKRMMSGERGLRNDTSKFDIIENCDAIRLGLGACANTTGHAR